MKDCCFAELTPINSNLSILKLNIIISQRRQRLMNSLDKNTTLCTQNYTDNVIYIIRNRYISIKIFIINILSCFNFRNKWLKTIRLASVRIVVIKVLSPYNFGLMVAPPAGEVIIVLR